MEYEEDRIEDFWWWVDERMKIFKRRFIDGESAPWTEDEILQKKHFTNPYRRLDRVTRYYLEDFVGDDIDPKSAFFTTFIFRIFNKESTMDVIGTQHPDTFDHEELIPKVEKLKEDGEAVFNNAYMVTGIKFAGSDSKVRNYLEGVFHDELQKNFDKYWQTISTESETKDPHMMTKEWEDIPGISDFLAYEVYTDLTYHDWFPFTENDYVNPGPGARRGIQYLVGIDDVDQDKHKNIEYVYHIANLCDMQHDMLPDDFPYTDEVGDMTLRSVEHSLCEFDKYIRAKRGRGRLRNFDPRNEKLGINEEADDPKWDKDQIQSGFGEF